MKHRHRKYEKLGEQDSMKKKTTQIVVAPPVGCEQKINKHKIKKCVKCDFCDIELSRTDALSRHLKICKVKQIKGEYDNKIKNIIDEKDKQIDELIVEKKSYENVIKIMSKNQNTQNTLIINNYSDSKSLKRVMGKVKLQLEPIDYVTPEAMIATIYGILHDNCILDVPQPERSIHCTDPSRNKFMYKHDDSWLVDMKAYHIIQQPIDKILEYIDKNNYSIHEKNIIIGMIFTVKQEKYMRKIRACLRADTVIQNMIEA